MSNTHTEHDPRDEHSPMKSEPPEVDTDAELSPDPVAAYRQATNRRY